MFVGVEVELASESESDQMIEVVVTFSQDSAPFALGAEFTALAVGST